MRIVQINICDNGSTGKIMMDILSTIDDSVQKRAYVSKKYGNSPIVYQMHSNFDYKVHKFLSMYLGLDEWGSYFSTKKLIKELKKFKPDILHLHNIHSNSINFVLLFKYIKKYNIKTIWTLHDCWAFTGGCFYFDYNNCNKWKTQCNHCQYLKSAGMATNIDCTKKLYKLKKKAFTGVKDMTLVTPSKWLANLVGQSFLSEYPIKVINNGINLDNFYYQDNHTFDNIIDRNKRILLGVATPFNERKGYSDFIKLSQLIDNDKYQIVMVGLSESQIQSLPSNIVGIKRTDNQSQLAELYSIAYAFINLTYEDNFPTVNIEALACGTPVICYKTGGATEMLNSSNAIVIKKGNVDEIPKVLSDIERLKNNKESFQKETKQLFSRERMTADYLNLYFEENI